MSAPLRPASRGPKSRILALVVGGLMALTAPSAASAASLELSVTPAQPTSRDLPNINYHWDATGFNPGGGDRFTVVEIYVVPASGGACPATGEAASAARYQPPSQPATWYFAHRSSVSGYQLDRTGTEYGRMRLPAGSYLLCGYMYDWYKNPDTAYGDDPGGVPDVGPIAVPLQVHDPRAELSLTTQQAGDQVNFDVSWRAERSFTGLSWGPDFEGYRWGPEIGALVYRDGGSRECPNALTAQDLNSDQFVDLIEPGPPGGTWGEGSNPDRFSEGQRTVEKGVRGVVGPDGAAGSYLVCGYVYFWCRGGHALWVCAADFPVFTDARLAPTSVPLDPEIEGGGGGGGGGGSSDPPDPVSACRKLQPTIQGTDGNDVIVGTDGPDVIWALKGNDRVRGGDGDDVICMFGGNDRASGGKGNDAINGSKQNDVLHGDAGNDNLYGFQGRDKVFGDTGRDMVNGGPGAGDKCDGGSGADKTRKGCESLRRIERGPGR